MQSYTLLFRYLKMRLFTARKIAIFIACIFFLLFILPEINKHGKGSSSRIHDSDYIETKYRRSVKVSIYYTANIYIYIYI